MDTVFKMRLLITPESGFENCFQSLKYRVNELEAGDDEYSIIHKLAVLVPLYSEGLCIASGQWIYIDDDCISFAVTASSPDSLVAFASNLAAAHLCIKAVWAGKEKKLSYFVANDFESNTDLQLPVFYCASMGRAFFYGDGYGKFFAPGENELKRQEKYYKLVWNQPMTNGNDIYDFFASLDQSYCGSSEDVPTFPIERIIDEYGNKFDLSISGDVRGNIAFGSKKIFVLPVKKMLLEGMNLSDFPPALIYKYPKEFEKAFKLSNINSPLDYLRCYEFADTNAEADVGGYLLNKAGEKIKSLADFDHTIGLDGEVYYCVPESDLEIEFFSKAAYQKWCKRFGIKPYCIQDSLIFSFNKTEVIGPRDKSLVSIVVPEGVKKIRANAFNSCTKLEKISLPKSLEVIGLGAFYACSSLKSIIIPDNIKEFPCSKFEIESSSGIFSGCTSLENIQLGKTLEKIEMNTFCNCTSLKSITIPASVKEISSCAFGGASSFSEIIVEEGSKYFKSYEGLLYSADGSELLMVPEGLKGCVKILESVKIFVDFPFAFHDKITKIILPPQLEELCLQGMCSDFMYCSDDLKLVFSDPESWFGTDDYDCYKNHRGGKKIPPEKLQEALKEYAFFYHHSFHIVKAK